MIQSGVSEVRVISRPFIRPPPEERTLGARLGMRSSIHSGWRGSVVGMRLPRPDAVKCPPRPAPQIEASAYFALPVVLGCMMTSATCRSLGLINNTSLFPSLAYSYPLTAGTPAWRIRTL
jgi:hypothetical protein